MKIRTVVLLGVLSTGLLACRGHEPAAPEDARLQRVEAVMPGASELMLQMGERYKNLYWAAKQGRWDFAAYQAEEMEELVEKLALASPKRAASANAFLQRVYPALPQAIASREWRRFDAAFAQMRAQCMDCHAKNDHAYITLPVPKTASSPVLNLP